VAVAARTNLVAAAALERTNALLGDAGKRRTGGLSRCQAFVTRSVPTYMQTERPYLSTIRQFHFIGIGGIGMSGIAHLLLELDYRVSGSDIKASPLTRRLSGLGAVVHEGHEASHLDGAEAVVVSSAVPETNPELRHARETGLPVIHRSQMLAELMDRQRGIAIAGTHGKSTTTSMIGVVFQRHGADPTVVVGGELNDLGGNARLGRGEYFIAEADESDGSFLNLHPQVAVVTNIEAEHLDHYASEAEVVATFERFLRALPADGTAVICGDCPNALQASEFMATRRLTYGFGDTCDLTAADVRPDGYQSRFTAFRHGVELGQLTLGVPGRQNVLNSLAPVATALEAGIPFETVSGALADFHGIGRRFEKVAETAGILLIDDYAHHPTEVRATLRAARDGFPDRRIVCVFQPHRYSRTQFLGAQFGTAFTDAGLVFVTDVYAAGEPPLEGVSGELIVDAVRQQDPSRCVRYLPDRKEVPGALKQVALPGDLVLTLGAGNIRESGVEFAQSLGAPVVASPPPS